MKTKNQPLDSSPAETGQKHHIPWPYNDLRDTAPEPLLRHLIFPTNAELKKWREDRVEEIDLILRISPQQDMEALQALISEREQIVELITQEAFGAATLLRREPEHVQPPLHLFFEKLQSGDGRTCDFKCNREWHRGKIRADGDWIFFNSPTVNWGINKNTADVSILVKNNWEEVKIDDYSFVFKEFTTGANPIPKTKPSPPSDQWKVGDVITKGVGLNLGDMEIVFVSGELIVCKSNSTDGDLVATTNYLRTELERNGWRLKETKPTPTKIEMLESELEKAKPTKERLKIGIGFKYSEIEQRCNPNLIEETVDRVRDGILRCIDENIEDFCKIERDYEHNIIRGEIELLLDKETYDSFQAKR